MSRCRDRDPMHRMSSIGDAKLLSGGDFPPEGHATVAKSVLFQTWNPFV